MNQTYLHLQIDLAQFVDFFCFFLLIVYNFHKSTFNITHPIILMMMMMMMKIEISNKSCNHQLENRRTISFIDEVVMKIGREKKMDENKNNEIQQLKCQNYYTLTFL
mgnify:CR=1 FL=1